MLEIFWQSLEYARFKLTDVGFGVFVYLARHVSNLVSLTFKNDEHIFLGISSLAKFVDTRVFLISEALDKSSLQGRADFVPHLMAFQAGNLVNVAHRVEVKEERGTAMVPPRFFL